MPTESDRDLDAALLLNPAPNTLPGPWVCSQTLWGLGIEPSLSLVPYVSGHPLPEACSKARCVISETGDPPPGVIFPLTRKIKDKVTQQQQQQK